MTQSRRQSLLETVTNTFVGTLGSLLITYVTVSNVADPLVASVITVAGCTVWSLVRGYFIRRRFNSILAEQKL